MNRREFLRAGGSCLGYLQFSALAAPAVLRSIFGKRILGEVLAAEPWARIESLGEGVWACVSTPLAA